MSEVMDIVNDNNEIVGQTTQDEIYAQKHSHRIVHVFVIHPKENKVYFQKRAETKSFLPGYYCTSAGGHVQAGESYEEAAKRELREEIGLNTELQEVGSMLFEADDHKRFIKLFVTFAEDGFDFADGEVASGHFVDVQDAYNLVCKDEKIHPQLGYCYKWLFEKKPELLTRAT